MNEPAQKQRWLKVSRRTAVLQTYDEQRGWHDVALRYVPSSKYWPNECQKQGKR